MVEKNRLDELKDIINNNEKVRKILFFNMVEYERINGIFLFITHYNVNLNDLKYKDIKVVTITNFDLSGLNKFVSERKDIKFLINFPTAFTNDNKKELFNNKEKYKNVFFIDDKFKEYSTYELIKIEESMDLMVKDIKESSLSPYEKYIAIYDIVKSYKCYKVEPDESFSLSRNEYMFVMSDYGVCLGYVKFLQALLFRIGILSDDLICDGNHSILISYIKDSKYNIDSFQLCDPTSDSIKSDYTQKPLIQSYRSINMIFDDTYNNYSNIDLLSFFKETNYEKMKEYLNYEFGKNKLKFLFNKLASLIGDKEMILNSQDEVMNIFKDLVSIIGDDSSKYDIDTAKFVIDYIGKKISQKIDLDTRLMAIYNVYNFVNKDLNNNYADFVCDNFSFKNYFMGFTLPSRKDIDDIIDELEFEQVVEMYLNCSSFYVNSSDFKNMPLSNIMYLYYFEKSLFDLGIVYCNGNIYLRNSLFNNINDISILCDKDSRLKYKFEFNNLYLIINEDMIHMKFKDFKCCINELVSNINSNRKKVLL